MQPWNPTFAHRTRKHGAPLGSRSSTEVHRSFAAFGWRLTSLRMTVFFVWLFCAVCFSQETRGRAESRRDGLALRRGTNEFGGWIGYSPFSFVLKGTSKDRQLLLVNLQYARTLFVLRPLTFKYTADVVPLALEFQPTQVYTVAGKPLVNPGGTLHAAGANPIGF